VSVAYTSVLSPAHADQEYEEADGYMGGRGAQRQKRRGMGDRIRPREACGCRSDSTGFQSARSSRHSNQFATKSL
jgi:hypothetical protein